MNEYAASLDAAKKNWQPEKLMIKYKEYSLSTRQDNIDFKSALPI